MPTLVDLHLRAVADFDATVAEIAPGQWSLPTPCADWDVRALVGHLVDELSWVPPLLAGETIAEVGDRFAGRSAVDDLAAACRAASETAGAAVRAPGALEGVAHVSYGDVPAETYLTELTLDLTVHRWDLARAIGAQEALDPRLVALGFSYAEPRRDFLVGSGLFAPPLPPPAGADDQIRLLALLGRRV